MSRVVVTGASGLLGKELVTAFRSAGDEVVGLTRAEVDVADIASTAKISNLAPHVVVNAAAWTDVDGCAVDPEWAMQINGVGAGLVARAAARCEALVIQISTNEVFDGTAHRPYTENDVPNPINPYGVSKLAGERAVASTTDRHLVVRTSWLFGRRRGFPSRILVAARAAAKQGHALPLVDDEWGNPTWAPELARAIVHATQLTLDGLAGHVLHIAGQPPTTRHDWARTIIDHLGMAPTISRISLAEFRRPSEVPPRAVLDTSLSRRLGIQPLEWRPALASHLGDVITRLAQ